MLINNNYLLATSGTLIFLGGGALITLGILGHNWKFTVTGIAVEAALVIGILACDCEKTHFQPKMMQKQQALPEDPIAQVANPIISQDGPWDIRAIEQYGDL